MVNINLLKNLVPLSSLLATDRAELARTARLGTYNAGQTIFTRGESACTLPYLLAGEVELFDGQVSRIVRAGKPGEPQQPLTLGAQRTHTASAYKKPAQVLLIDRNQLDLIQTWAQTGGVEVVELSGDAGESAASDQDWMTALLKNPAFHKIPCANIAQLFTCMQAARFAAGTEIIRQGERGDAYFVITRGSAVVQRRLESGDLAAPIELAVGTGFGEEALLSGNARNATVRTLTEVDVMRIEAKDFERLLRAPMLREMGLDEVTTEMQLVDVRLSVEYRSGHLPGAINLPLAHLRELAVQLTSERPLVVYCDSGRRSASAAYLLCERGFDARLIAGGVKAGLLSEQ